MTLADRGLKKYIYITDNPDNAAPVSHNEEKEPGRLKLPADTEARNSSQAMPVQGMSCIIWQIKHVSIHDIHFDMLVIMIHNMMSC